jgi:hypothetical protein
LTFFIHIFTYIISCTIFQLPAYFSFSFLS